MAPATPTSPPSRAAPQGIAYDAKTDTLAVAVHSPDRLLVLDPTTLRTKLSVQLPGKVRHLEVSPRGGTVLVPSETANTIFEIELTTGKSRGTKVQRHPHAATEADNGDVLVGNEFSGSVSVVRDGKVIHTFGGLRQPGGVVADGNTVAAIDVRDYSVTTFDLSTMKRIKRLPAGKGPTHGVLVGGGRMAVTDTRGHRVLLFDLDPLKQVGSLRLPGAPYGMVGDPSTKMVWVTLASKNRLIGLDVSGSTPKVIASYPTVRQPDTVAVAPGGKTLWVTGTKNGVIERITR